MVVTNHHQSGGDGTVYLVQGKKSSLQVSLRVSGAQGKNAKNIKLVGT